MKLELNYYKESGKWYTRESIFLNSLDDLPQDLEDNGIKGMLVTVHIIVESDEAGESSYKQPYRFFKL